MKTLAGAVAVVLLLACLGYLVYNRAEAEAAAMTRADGLEPAPSLTPAVTPGTAPAPMPEPAPIHAPEPYSDRPDIDISSWEYVLVNRDNRIGESFVPEVSELENGHYFDSRAVEALRDFLKGARDAGLTAILTSSYRPYFTQQYLFNNKVAQYGGDEAVAERIVARPGTSEHQTGLAADIVDAYYEYMDESLAETKLSEWMYENCAEYGFILRYPKDKQEITGIMFEPWHYRYVGVAAAEYIMENNLCLEEFWGLYG